MPSLPVKPHIRKEVIDRWTFDLAPKCFICNDLFQIGDEVTYFKGGGGVIRIGEECIEGFIASIEMYGEAFDKLRASVVDSSIN